MTYERAQYAKLFVFGKTFQASLMFLSKVGAYPSEDLSDAPL